MPDLAPTDDTDRHASDGSASDGPGSDASDSDSDASDEESEGRNALEWGVTLAGAAAVLYVVGYLIVQLVAGADEPADLRITLGAPEPSGAQVMVPVEVRNEGDRVAVGALVEVCAGPEVCSEVAFDYVPFGSTVSGMVGLEAPLAAPPTARVMSYRDP